MIKHEALRQRRALDETAYTRRALAVALGFQVVNALKAAVEVAGVDPRPTPLVPKREARVQLPASRCFEVSEALVAYWSPWFPSGKYANPPRHRLDASDCRGEALQRRPRTSPSTIV